MELWIKEHAHSGENPFISESEFLAKGVNKSSVNDSTYLSQKLATSLWQSAWQTSDSDEVSLSFSVIHASAPNQDVAVP
jgi:hypothetical protein